MSDTMIDRESVIRQLTQHIARADYIETDWMDCVSVPMLRGALALLKAQEPRVLTLDEFMAHWKLPPQERPPIWEEWKIDKGKGSWKLYGRATGGYGTLWRSWSARPTDEQREAVPWDD